MVSHRKGVDVRNFDRFASVCKNTFPFVSLATLDTVSKDIFSDDHASLVCCWLGARN
jgi:hypothetical protein